MDIHNRNYHVETGSGLSRIRPVDPEILGAALFYAAEYLRGKTENSLEPACSGAHEAGIDNPEIRFIEILSKKFHGDRELAESAALRIAALMRLLAANPDLRQSASHPEAEGGMLREETLEAAAEIELTARAGGVPEFDVKAFAAALSRQG
jgi:hypothetical protein